MIQVNQLSKKYNGTTVLQIDNLSIPKGQSFGLVGNNGAGKTTFFSLLLDLIQPTTGAIINNEIPVHTSENWKLYRLFLRRKLLNWLLNSRRIFLFHW